MIYQWLIRLLSPVLWLAIILDAYRRHGGGAYIRQRLGLSFPRLQFPDSNKEVVWLHCASVGEVKAAEALIRQLCDQYSILVTTSTPTGKDLLHRLFQQGVVYHRYLPLDWPYAIRRFLSASFGQYTLIRPRLWVLETEIWPNLYALCNKQGIEISIISGRLSRKSMNAPAWLRNTYRQTLQQVARILAISSAEAQRFIDLGAKESVVTVMGNLKFAGLHQMSEPERPIHRSYVLAASTHSGEELEISRLWLKLKRPELLVLVPRHPVRREQILKQLSFIQPAVRAASLGQSANEEAVVFLDDRIGKLMPLFAHAECVIMGGSFTPRGGHNVLEPAAYGQAILTGPDMSDFEAELALLKEYGGIVQCENFQQLEQQLKGCLEDRQLAAKLGRNARTAIESQHYVLENYLQVLLK